ncbi:MAG TPA: mannosyltransferase family protein [Acidimicrobiales bacterium]|nr:mannosyltransferase family protein [Acidimicrobiales bacterium]
MTPRPARSAPLRDAVLVASPPWLVARALVVSALALARYLVSHVHPSAAGVAQRAHEGLLGWDAGWYRSIADHGYGPLPREALRFFPLVPWCARLVHLVTAMPTGAALLVVVNVAALAAGALLYRLALAETGDPSLGRRAAWLLSLAPSAFVLVMGYSEAVLLVLTLVAFSGLRSGKWWRAAAAGYLAGLTRPLGVLLGLPAAVEAVGGLRGGARPRPRQLGSRAAAVVAPAAGCATYLGWVAWRFGDFWLPFRIQQHRNLHGRFADPATTISGSLRGLAHGHVGTALHVPWLAVLVLLLVVVVRSWPVSYAVFAAASLVAAVSATNLDSLERYALGAFPFILGAATVTARPRVETVALTLLGGAIGSYALLAFLNAYVP